MSRLRDALGVELPLRDLFEAPGWRTSPPGSRRRGGPARTAPLRLSGPSLQHCAKGPCPCRSPRSGSGSSISSTRAARSTTCRWRCASKGPLDPGVLALTLGEIVRRHEALRTVFARQGPRGRLAGAGDPAGRSLRAARRGSVRAAEGCARSTGSGPGRRRGRPAVRPRARSLAARPAAALGERDHAVALTLHHIASDGWSMGILVREVAALYPAFAGRPAVTLARAAGAVRGFRGLAALLAARRGAGQRDRLLARAARRTAAAPGAAHRPAAAGGAELPGRGAAGAAAGRAHPADGGPRPARGRDALHGAAGRLPGAAGTLQRTGRPRGGLARRRPQPGGDRRIDRVLRQHPGPARRSVRARPRSASCSAGCGRRRSPPTCTRTCRSKSWSRSWRRSEASPTHPLFQVMLALQNAPAGEPGDPGPAPAAAGRGRRTTAKFDLTLEPLRTSTRAGSRGIVEYATDLFDAATIDRLIAPLRNAARPRLVAAGTAPELPVAELPLLRPGRAASAPRRVERHPAGQPPAMSTLHGRFEARARQAPAAPALSLRRA